MIRVATLAAPLAAMALLAGGAPARADADAGVACAIMHLTVTGFQEWVADPHLVTAIRDQNARTANLAEAEILSLDASWRAETEAGTRPTISPVLGHPLSERLRVWQMLSEGVVTEIIVMDAKGLNVAVSDVTSDYWQGDEAKWTETYARGALSPHVGDVEVDASTGALQAQISVTVVDPEDGAPIGAATFGVRADC